MICNLCILKILYYFLCLLPRFFTADPGAFAGPGDDDVRAASTKLTAHDEHEHLRYRQEVITLT